MAPLDYLHVSCLLGVVAYIALREPPRILLAPLTLVSFFFLYGIGNFVYFAGADTVPDVRAAVTLSLVLMWIFLVLGMELARLSAPRLTLRAQQVVRRWRTSSMSDRHDGDQLLALVGLAVAAYIWGVFLYFHKPTEIINFVSIVSWSDKAKFRHDFGPEGGYLYQTLIASVAPFVSFVVLVKGLVFKRHLLVIIGLLLAGAVFAGKIGTFEKTPWLIYILQFIVVAQVVRSLRLGVGRILAGVIVTVVGVLAAVKVAIPEMDAPDLAEWLAYRFFEVNNEVVYQTLYVYPHYLPHTWGMNIGLIHNIFGSGDLVSAHNEVANFFGAEGATFDSFFIGDAWVDFSYGGVVAMSLIVGFVVKMVDSFVMSLGKTPLSVAMIGSGTYGLFQLLVTSAFTAFLSGGLVLIPMLALASIALVNDLTRGAHMAQAQPSP